MTIESRIHNCYNENQGDWKRVLCVCSAGLLRSPTAALVLSREPFNFNTRAAGLIREFSLIMVDRVLVAWADEIVCMTEGQKIDLQRFMKRHKSREKPIVCLGIEDDFAYRDSQLADMVKERYRAAAGRMLDERRGK